MERLFVQMFNVQKLISLPFFAFAFAYVLFLVSCMLASLCYFYKFAFMFSLLCFVFSKSLFCCHVQALDHICS